MGRGAGKSAWHGGLAAIVAVAFLGGCTNGPRGEQVSYINAIGMPFYLALRMPACVATLVAVGPFSTLEGLAAPGERDSLPPDIRPTPEASAAENCGGSPELPYY